MTSINHAEVAETLHRAADLIEQEWQHGPPVDGSAWDWDGEGSASLCLGGAIFAALDRPRYWASNEINACPAGRAVRDHLADRFAGDNLWTWNDDPQRTASEVIEVLRATELPPIQRFEDGSWSVTLPAEVGATITHPKPRKRDASGYLSVATVPTDCTGSSWPLRLFEVTAADVWKDGSFPNKRCTHALTVVREVEAHVALGPQGRELVALIGRCGALTSRELWELAAAWDAAWAAAWDAAWALTVRDLIGDTFTQAHYDALTGPWRKTLGPLHPDDTDIREVTQ